jgi:hypothetical protein
MQRGYYVRPVVEQVDIVHIHVERLVHCQLVFNPVRQTSELEGKADACGGAAVRAGAVGLAVSVV